jgi:hypothetical protein
MLEGAKAPASSRAASGPSTAHAPGLNLPLRFILSGLAALALALSLLIAKPGILTTYHYNQHVIAITHLVVLGWICSGVMGAVYQLVPVALETPLYSERLAKVQFLFHLAGWSGMVWTFWTWNMTQVGHFGSALAFGVLLFVYNIFRTLLRVPRWSVVATGVASSMAWLGFTVLLGLLIVAGKCSYDLEGNGAPSGLMAGALQGLRSAGGLVTGFDQIAMMHTHAHVGVVGVFLMLIVGVSYRLVPMFTLSEIQRPRWATASVWTLNAGLLMCLLTIPLRTPWKLAGTALLLTGLGLYALELCAILHARKRRSLDWGVKSFLTALCLLPLLGALACILSWPALPLNAFTGQLENVYGFLGLVGVISLAVIGMLYKIVPFLVWYRAYSRHIGLARIPALADLYSHRIQIAGFWMYLGGLAITASGTVLQQPQLVQGGCFLLFLSFASVAWNICLMLSHLIRPRLSSFPGRSLESATAHPAAVLGFSAR